MTFLFRVSPRGTKEVIHEFAVVIGNARNRLFLLDLTTNKNVQTKEIPNGKIISINKGISRIVAKKQEVIMIGVSLDTLVCVFQIAPEKVNKQL